jgi:vitamin B12 transporter
MFRKTLLFAILLGTIGLPPMSVWAQGAPDSMTGGSELLGTVVITASRTAEQLRSVSSNITVITEQQIEMQGANDLGDVLRHEGNWGVDYGASKYIQIRGLSSGGHDNTQLGGRVLILVNGRRTGAYQVNEVPMYNVERIEIIRGPGAVQYGSSGLGGIINVITKRGAEDTFSGVVEVGIGSFDLYKTRVGFSGGYQGFDFSGSYSYLEHGDISLMGGIKYPHTASLHKSASFDIGYTFADKHRIGFNYNYSLARDEWPGTGYRDWDYVGGSDDLTTYYGIYKPEITSIGFTYEGSTESGNFDWSTFYTQSRYRRPSMSHYPDYYFTPPSPNWINQDVKNGGASVGFNSRYLDVNLGFDYITYDIMSKWDGEFGTRNIGLYVSSKVKLLNDTLFINLGGRYDDYLFEEHQSSEFPSRTKKKFSPAFGISYIPLEWMKLRANYSQGLRMPMPNQYVGIEVTTEYGPTKYWPNPNLQPEESETIEFGIDVDYQFFSSSLTYFHTDFQNMIRNQDYPHAPGIWFVNLERAILSGIELSMSADLGKAFDLGFVLRPHLNFTYMTKATNRDSILRLVDGSDDLAYVPKWTLAWGVSLDHRGLDLSADLTAVHFGDIINNVTWGNARTFVQKPGLASLDVTLEKGIFTFGSDGDAGTVKLRLEVKNVFDSHNEVYYDYPGPGRNFYLGLKYVF